MLIYHEVENKLINVHNTQNYNLCALKYSMIISLYGNAQQPSDSNNVKNLFNSAHEQYLSASRKTLTDLGCSMAYTENETESALLIHVNISQARGGTPQEFLSGLTLGIIPAWLTHEREYTYTFTNNLTRNENSYYIDQKASYHLILLPIFWVNFFTADELNIYEKCLEDFLENSKGIANDTVSQ